MPTAIRAPWGEDPELRAAVRRLREDIAGRLAALNPWDHSRHYLRSNPLLFVGVVAQSVRTAAELLRRQHTGEDGDCEFVGLPPRVWIWRALAQDDIAVVAIEGALDVLNPRQREIVELFHGCGLPIQEIAARLDLPIGTVKSRKRA